VEVEAEATRDSRRSSAVGATFGGPAAAAAWASCWGSGAVSASGSLVECSHTLIS
jgi:hypothetical protein